MKRRSKKRSGKVVYILAVIMIAIAFLSVAVSAFTAEPEAAAGQRKIEVVFTLDTTGSMGGLIDGAKRKIWSILNQIVSGKPTPDVRVGLVAYRDRADKYVTQITDLTDDLDGVYEKLTAFQAHGGGDTPESVNQALHEAVTKISWSEGDDVLRVVFLVGDSPPHMDYQDDVQFPETCQLAMKKAIIINTIRCGANRQTEDIWRKIADLGEGTYLSIAQSGGVQAITTPYDEEIARLDRELRGTAVFYGRGEVREEARRALSRTDAALAAAPVEAAADRVAYMSKAARPPAASYAAADLVEAIEAKSVELEKLKDSELPDELKTMTTEERKAYIAKRVEERKKIQAQLDELNKKRAAHLAAERAKAAEKPADKDAFDVKVSETIRRQAAKVGVTYPE